jgi:DNA (cytosine-5)-methyltransferase 1
MSQTQGVLFEGAFAAPKSTAGHAQPVESFSIDYDGNNILRHIETRGGIVATSSLPIPNLSSIGEDLASSYDETWLRLKNWPPFKNTRGTVRIVDLFSGCGALTLGVIEACRSLELRPEPLLAVDINNNALAIYKHNFPGAKCMSVPVESIIDSELGDPISESERRLKNELGHVDILIGGPPCQGHSDLNNHTRRADPKNALFSKMARLAEVIEPNHVIIENVPGVVHDERGVVDTTWSSLLDMGYSVEGCVLRADNLGVPQRRRRYITAASRLITPSLKDLESSFRREERSFAWACADLLDICSDSIFNQAAVHSPTNQKRINYLFDNDIYDLPDSERPDCHRLKKHSYRSVYGRMYWDKPAPTITAGFGSTGQGRFVHPKFRRTLTPHEAARLQFIPDFFSFDVAGVKRRPIQDMIGNAVPPKLSYGVALELLR